MNNIHRTLVVFVIMGTLAVLLWPTNVSTPPAEQTVQLYYYDPELDKDPDGNLLCSEQGLISVDRRLVQTPTRIEDTIRLLLTGELTQQERALGVTTEYPLERFTLTDTALDDGTLILTFSDPQMKTSGGACRVSILWKQIEITAKQFPEVSSVRFLPEELFQP